MVRGSPTRLLLLPWWLFRLYQNPYCL